MNTNFVYDHFTLSKGKFAGVYDSFNVRSGKSNFCIGTATDLPCFTSDLSGEGMTYQPQEPSKQIRREELSMLLEVNSRPECIQVSTRSTSQDDFTEELDYTPGKLHINHIIRPKYITKEDELGNQAQVIAPLNRPIPKCIASAAMLTMIFINKYIYHLPLYRTLAQIRQMGVPLPGSTLESWVKLGAELIRPLYAVHRLYVFREIYQMIDESPIKVQYRDKPRACHQGYIAAHHQRDWSVYPARAG